MNKQLKDRFNRIIPTITSPSFLSNSGLGEIGFYIFDYPPEDELAVREYVEFMLELMPKQFPVNSTMLPSTG